MPTSPTPSAMFASRQIRSFTPRGRECPDDCPIRQHIGCHVDLLRGLVEQIDVDCLEVLGWRSAATPMGQGD
jgi:hypothetical protein